MEAVAADALRLHAGGEGEAPRRLRQRAVERGVETGDLWNAGIAGGDGLDGRQRGRQMQRGERHGFAQPLHHGCVDAHRLEQVGPAVHEPVAHRGRRGEDIQSGVHRIGVRGMPPGYADSARGSAVDALLSVEDRAGAAD